MTTSPSIATALAANTPSKCCGSRHQLSSSKAATIASARPMRDWRSISGTSGPIACAVNITICVSVSRSVLRDSGRWSINAVSAPSISIASSNSAAESRSNTSGAGEPCELYAAKVPYGGESAPGPVGPLAGFHDSARVCHFDCGCDREKRFVVRGLQY